MFAPRPLASVLAPVAFLAIALASPGMAQDYHVHTYTVTHGLPSGFVYSAAQDTLGQIWLGTRTGVVVYDGVEWVTHGHDAGLKNFDVAFLRQDRGGRHWCVGRNPFSMAYRHDGVEWQAVGAPADATHDFLVLAAEFLEVDGEEFFLLGTNDGDIYALEDETWSNISIPEIPGGSNIGGLAQTPRGALICAEDRVLVLEGSASGLNARTVALSPGGKLCTITYDRKRDTTWVIGAEHVFQLIGDRLVEVADTPQLNITSNHPLHIVSEPDGIGGVFFATIEAMAHYHPDSGVRPFGIRQGLASEGATDLLTDREGNIWVGSYRGMSKIVTLGLTNYDSQSGLLEDEVSAVLERRDGSMVLGHPTGLTLWSQDQGLTALPFPPYGHAMRVLDLFEGDDGTVWGACADKGLLRLAPDNSMEFILTSEHVNSVIQDETGRLWASSSETLFFTEDDSLVPLDTSVMGVPWLYARRLFPSKHGGFYIATARYGLIKMEADQTSQWTPMERAAPGVYAVLEREGSELWVGSGDGLWLVNDEEAVPMRPDLGGPSVDRPVYFLAEHDNGEIWIGTDNGVIVWDGQTSRHITMRDGLAGSETNRAAGIIDAAGRVWIGTARGLSIYDARHVAPREAGPSSRVVAVDVGGQSFSLRNQLKLPHNQNSLTFRFRAISFVDESRLRVESWLEGFDEGWLAPYWSPLQEIRYTNLPAGTYRFHIRAIDATGRRSEIQSSSQIVIARPIWTRPWFLLLASVLAAGILASLVRVFARERYAQQLEAEVEDRIRDLHASELAKQEESERLRVTLQSIGDGVIATDQSGCVVLCNSAAEAITGWSQEEAQGRPLGEVLRLHPLTHDESLRPGEMPRGDMSLVNRRGERLTMEITNSPIRDSRGSVLAFRNITGKRAMETELAKSQRLQSLGILAGGIAHDFNNLLTVVLGNISLVGSESEQEPVHQKRLNDARDATLRARSLTQQLLTFSRGGAPLREASSIADVVRDSASFVLSGSKVRCEINLAADLWMVDIDPGQMNQVVNNLLLNANQAMPEGGVIHVRGRNQTTTPPGLAHGSWVVIEVQDEGEGIAPEQLSQVFDPYFTTKQEGSGLGLATAYSIVKRHDGLLRVESTLGKGSTFQIFLPRSVSEARTAATSNGTLRVLLMDDDPDVRKVTADLLGASGYEVSFAVDGDEALARYREAMDSGRMFNAVIMDLTVRGGMGGREAMHRLLEMDSQAPGIVASGYSNDPVMANHAAYGFRARITKPFLRHELECVLEEVIGRRPEPA